MKRAALILPILVAACTAIAPSRVDAGVLYVALIDRIIQLHDLNADGDFFDFAETSVYADALPAPLGRLAAHAGWLYVADPANAAVLAIGDLNGDGDALDFGEVVLFGQLPPSIPSAMLTALAARADGSLYAADATTDALFVLRDLNTDGDALDFGETLAVADGLVSPIAVAVRPDGLLLVAQPDSAVPVRILEDRNADGDFFDFAENLSYAENKAPGEDLIAASETLAYLTRPLTGEVIALRDLTGDDDALDFGEIVVHATDLDAPRFVTDDGTGGLFIAADDPPGTVIHVRDLNGDGDALDFGEAIGVATGLNQPAGIVFIPPPAAACVQGDINNDTQVNINDLAPFVDILVGISIPPDPCPADMNEDGQINAVDIQPFVDLLTSNP